MSGPESKISQPLMKALRKEGGNYYCACRIESGDTVPGIPDINYCFGDRKRGWIESKVINKMPVRHRKLEKWTKEQRLFGRMRWQLGEPVYLYLKAGNDYFLFRTIDIDYIESMRPEDFEKALGHWKKKVDYTELIAIL